MFSKWKTRWEEWTSQETSNGREGRRGWWQGGNKVVGSERRWRGYGAESHSLGLPFVKGVQEGGGNPSPLLSADLRCSFLDREDRKQPGGQCVSFSFFSCDWLGSCLDQDQREANNGTRGVHGAVEEDVFARPAAQRNQPRQEWISQWRGSIRKGKAWEPNSSHREVLLRKGQVETLLCRLGKVNSNSHGLGRWLQGCRRQ